MWRPIFWRYDYIVEKEDIMNNMQQIIKQAQKLQEKLGNAQKELEAKEVTGTSGAGLVSVVLTLKGSAQSIKIDSSIINPDDKEMLEDLIIAAINDAKVKGDKIFEDGMKEASGGMDMSKLSGGLF